VAPFAVLNLKGLHLQWSEEYSGNSKSEPIYSSRKKNQISGVARHKAGGGAPGGMIFLKKIHVFVNLHLSYTKLGLNLATMSFSFN